MDLRDLVDRTIEAEATQKWALLDPLWRQLEEAVEQVLVSIAPGAFCTAQAWDRRIECTIAASNGSIVGEMVLVENVTVKRIMETAERLRLCADGSDVALIDPLTPPIRIVGQRS